MVRWLWNLAYDRLYLPAFSRFAGSAVVEDDPRDQPEHLGQVAGSGKPVKEVGIDDERVGRRDPVET